jgi:hypothetical protein
MSLVGFFFSQAVEKPIVVGREVPPAALPPTDVHKFHRFVPIYARFTNEGGLGDETLRIVGFGYADVDVAIDGSTVTITRRDRIANENASTTAVHAFPVSGAILSDVMDEHFKLSEPLRAPALVR